MFSILSIHPAASQPVTHGQNIGEPQPELIEAATEPLKNDRTQANLPIRHRPPFAFVRTHDVYTPAILIVGGGDRVRLGRREPPTSRGPQSHAHRIRTGDVQRSFGPGLRSDRR